MLIYLFLFVFLILKVSPEEFGGWEAFNDIKSDFTALFGYTDWPTNLSQMCYCKAPLDHAEFANPFSGWRCLSCLAANQSGRSFFRCVNEFCILKLLSGVMYQVCPSCYWSTEIDGMDEKEDDTENKFICRKMKSNINMIRYSFDALMAKRGDGTFMNTLESTVLKMDADSNRQCFRNASNITDLSWQVMKVETKESMIKRFQSTLSLSYLQCLIIYESMQSIDPDVVDSEIKERAQLFHAIFLQDILLKCMFKSCCLLSFVYSLQLIFFI